MKRALVTGSTKGIGLSISARLIACGYFVYMNYAHDDSTAAKIDFPADKHKIIKADLSIKNGADILITALSNDITIDCLVLNAGTTCRKPFEKIDYDDINEVMNTNVNIPFLICRKLYPHMVNHGSIIFIGSDMGIYPHAKSPVYSVSKAAAHMLAQSLVKEFAEKCVRINTISPGFIDTEWQQEKPEWLREKIENKIALKRFGKPEEVADACMFLIENTYTNGAVIQVNGGYNME